MFKREVHSHDTRNKHKIYTDKVKHALAQKSLRHSLPLLLNNLPEIVKEKLISHSTQGFAKYVKLYLLQSYQVACTMQDCYVCMYATIRIKNHLPTLCCMYTYLYIFTYTYILKIVP